MITVFVLLFFVVTASADVYEEWEKFQNTYGRHGTRGKDDIKRFENFQKNYETIIEHNKKYANKETTFFMKINQFSDLNFDEFKEHIGLHPKHKPVLESATFFQSSLGNGTIPVSFNWKDKNVVSDIKDQGQCGSCWAFSAIAALENRYIMRHNKKVNLSEQQLVDCSTEFPNKKCNGGDMGVAFEYIKKNGIMRQEDYKYVAQGGTCKANKSKYVDIKVTGFTQITSGNENDLKEAVFTRGVMACAIHTTEKFQHYSGGIFKDDTCYNKPITHGIAVVGYGREGSDDFWIVKNSWGKTWGDQGYIKMLRNHEDQCNIATYCFSPDIQA